MKDMVSDSFTLTFPDGTVQRWSHESTSAEWKPTAGSVSRTIMTMEVVSGPVLIEASPQFYDYDASIRVGTGWTIKLIHGSWAFRITTQPTTTNQGG